MYVVGTAADQRASGRLPSGEQMDIDIPQSMPEDFKIRSPVQSDYKIDSYKRVLTPQQQLYTTKGNKIVKFDIPNDGMFDFKTGLLSAVITVLSDGIPAVGTGPAYLRLVQGSWNVIERQRHLQDHSKLEERYNSFDIENMNWVFEQDPAVEATLGHSMLGIGTQADRDTWALAPKTYAIPVDLGLLTAGIFPAKFLKEFHQIEFYLNDPLIALESNCGNLEIQLSNIEWTVYGIRDTRFTLDEKMQKGWVQPPSFEKKMLDYIQSGFYQVVYDSFGIFQNNVFNQQHDLIIAHRAKRVKEVLSVFQNLQDRYNPQVNDKLMTFLPLNMTTFQFKVNGAYWPEVPIKCGPGDLEGYHQYVRWVAGWGLNAENMDDPQDAPIITIDEFNLDSFIMIGDMKNYRDLRFLNNLNTAAHTQDMLMLLRLSASPPANTCVFHYIKYSTIAKIEGNGCTKFVIDE